MTQILQTATGRWREVLPAEEAVNASVIHASLRMKDGVTLCEKFSGKTVDSVVDVTLNLDGPQADQYRHTVNCRECLELMHS